MESTWKSNASSSSSSSCMGKRRRSIRQTGSIYIYFLTLTMNSNNYYYNSLTRYDWAELSWAWGRTWGGQRTRKRERERNRTDYRHISQPNRLIWFVFFFLVETNMVFWIVQSSHETNDSPTSGPHLPSLTYSFPAYIWSWCLFVYFISYCLF